MSNTPATLNQRLRHLAKRLFRPQALPCEPLREVDTKPCNPLLLPEPSKIWIDVGAHRGEKTFPIAEQDPTLRVYAFEPNLEQASKVMGRLANFIVLPFAIAEENGMAMFYRNGFSAASSLLPFHEPGLNEWVGGEELREVEQIHVPTIRLDTFLKEMGITKVDYLKIDAQGADLAIIRSLGDRLRDVEKLCLEVQVTPIQLYAGGSDASEVHAYMASRGFALTVQERQSHNQEENLTFVRIPRRAA
jgi:FkbM family methyltransferase